MFNLLLRRAPVLFGRFGPKGLGGGKRFGPRRFGKFGFGPGGPVGPRWGAPPFLGGPFPGGPPGPFGPGPEFFGPPGPGIEGFAGPPVDPLVLGPWPGPGPEDF